VLAKGESGCGHGYDMIQNNTDTLRMNEGTAMFGIAARQGPWGDVIISPTREVHCTRDGKMERVSCVYHKVLPDRDLSISKWNDGVGGGGGRM